MSHKDECAALVQYFKALHENRVGPPRDTEFIPPSIPLRLQHEDGTYSRFVVDGLLGIMNMYANGNEEGISDAQVEGICESIVEIDQDYVDLRTDLNKLTWGTAREIEYGAAHGHFNLKHKLWRKVEDHIRQMKWYAEGISYWLEILKKTDAEKKPSDTNKWMSWSS
jgi:hypothetical protein